MKILFLCKGCHDSGNFATISRISKNIRIERNSIETDIFNISEGSDNASEFIQLFNNFKPDLVIGLNLIRCSFINTVGNSKIIIILGGTDVNAEMHYDVEVQTTDLVKKCSGFVAFNQNMKSAFLKLCRKMFIEKSVRVDIIPQGVDIDMQFNSMVKSENDEMLSELNISQFFVVIGRLRSVKDPSFVIEPFSDWCSYEQRQNFSLLFIGDIEENSTEIQLFLNNIKRFRNMHHVGSIAKERIADVIQRAKAIINCSKHEGQSLVLLEAMTVGTPVIARCVPGNVDLIVHGFNGLLFNNNQEFRNALSNVLEDCVARKLISNAKSFILKCHDSRLESQKYLSLISDVISS